MKPVISIGNQDFGSIRENGYFYRPRRFGKTLNMSMLRAFFEVGAEANLFDGLYISHKKDVLERR